MSDRLKITREKLMQLPKDELVTELLGALEFVVSQHAASMHAELVAALQEIAGLGPNTLYPSSTPISVARAALASLEEPKP